MKSELLFLLRCQSILYGWQFLNYPLMDWIFVHLSYFVVLIQKCACKVRCVLRCPCPLVYTKLIAMIGKTAVVLGLLGSPKCQIWGIFCWRAFKVLISYKVLKLSKERNANNTNCLHLFMSFSPVSESKE